MPDADSRDSGIGSYSLVAVLLVVFTAGCGSPHGTVKVFGQVTVNGEKPPGSGTISFTSVEPAAGFPNRPAMAKFGTDGSYEATSFDPSDGLVPGKYKIAVECYETPPNMDGKPTKSYIDKKYMNGETSGFELNVEPGSKPIRFDIDLE